MCLWLLLLAATVGRHCILVPDVFGEPAGFVGQWWCERAQGKIILRTNMRRGIKRYAIVFAAWLPFFAIWIFFAMSYAHYPLRAALVTSMISMGSASIMGIAVWHICRLWPWPLRLDLRFYFLQIFLASAYSIFWSILVYWLESVRRGSYALRDIRSSSLLGWQLLMGVWLYGVFAGVSYAVQTRSRLHHGRADW